MNKTFKKFFSLVLAAVIVLSTLTQVGIVASAEETSVLTFTVKNGKATITKADASATVIEIPAEYEGVPVTAVGQNAFISCYNITEFVVDENSEHFSTDENGVLFNKDKTELVKFPPASDVTEYDIPESVTDFGHYAFFHATKLQRVSIPGSIEQIGVTVFYDCGNLQEIEFSEGLTRIGEQAFGFCGRLTNIDLPDSLKYIDMAAFVGCNLTGVLELPESLNPIASKLTWSEVFGGQITAYSVPESNNYLSTDENGVLYNKEKTVLLSVPRASELSEYQVPESVTEIATGAFAYASGLDAIICHDGITKIGKSAFRDTKISSFLFSACATEVPEAAFENCTVLEKVVLSNYVTVIGKEAFWNCDSLDFIDIPETVTAIEERAFYSSGIKSVILPNSVVDIGKSAFDYCVNLTDVYYTGTADEWNSMSIAEGNEYLTSANIHYNFGKTQGDLGENLMWDFDEDTKTLSFYGSGDMLSFDTFEEYPWYSLKEKIEFVYFGNGVTSVGDNAFNGCTALKEAFLGYTVEKVGVNAFTDCPSLALVTACAVNFTAEDNSFVGNDERLVLLYNSSSSQILAYAQEKGIKTIAVSYDGAKDVLSFAGDFTVYEDLNYNLLVKLIQNNKATKYLYFEKLVFDGVTSGNFDIDGLEGVVANEDYLTFKNLYISITAIKGDGEESITFAQLIEKLESGDHEGFLIEIESESGKEKVDFMKAFDHFVTSALKMISKLINLISKAFKRK